MRAYIARLLLALVLAAAMPHACGARAFAEPRVAGLPNSVRTGESIDIAWSELPAGTHEVELEVSIEGGNWKRISPELEAHAGHFAWRVPAGMHGNARVRLRLGSEHGEVDSAPSEPFWIEGPTSSGPTWLDEDGRWDTRGGFGHVMPSELVDAVPHLTLSTVGIDAELPPRMGAANCSLRCTARTAWTLPTALASLASRPRTTRVFTPLRN